MRLEAPVVAIGTEPVISIQEAIITEEIHREGELIHSSPVKKLVATL
jgi:hypothetical protein